MENITMIRIERLHPHPDNPRKNLGDLTELTASIKENGIFQNLTVVPFETTEGEYTVIIGNRRLAAAQAAGLTEVPCAIVEMSEQEQLQTMLTENMQRADLTIIEQAEGMQMVLDLGISVADLSKQTGFSETTIRRRVKLLKLDRTELEAAEGRGGTLKDYMALDEIEDPGRKTKVLKTIGTRDFIWGLKNALEEEKTIKALCEIEKKLAEFAEQLAEDETKGKAIIRNYYSWRTSYEEPKDANENKYYYTIKNPGKSGMMVRLYVDIEDDDEEPSASISMSKEWEWLDEMADRDAETGTMLYELRRQFISEIPESRIGAHIETIIKALLHNLDSRHDPGIYKIMGIKTEGLGWKTKPDAEELSRYIDEHPARALMLYAWGRIDDDSILIFEGDEWDDYDTKYVINQDDRNLDRLKEIYDFLKEFGYEMSTEEKEYLDGTKLRELEAEFEELFPGKLHRSEVEE